MSLGNSFKRNSVFLSLWLASVLALIIAISLVDKAALHLLLCDHHASWADWLMPVLSETCNWLPYLAAVVLLVWRWRAGLFLSSSLILSTLLVQALKHVVQAPRPLTWFATHHPDIALPLTDGVTMNYYLSFPSGHTTTFFCLYFALCVLFTWYKKAPSCDRKVSYAADIAVQVLLFGLAAVSSYSRIYLSQHFALDVLAGMILGVLSVAIVAAVARRIYDSRHHNSRIHDAGNSSDTDAVAPDCQPQY